MIRRSKKQIGSIALLWLLVLLAFLLGGIPEANISLAFPHPQAGGCPPVANTPYMTIVYGSVTLGGVPAPVGTVVEARNPRGDTVGCMVLSTVGVLPLTSVYGEDSTANPPIPGMRDGEKVAFFVNGYPATVTSTWDQIWHDDRTPHQVDLSAIGHNHWGESWSGTGVGLMLISTGDFALKAISRSAVGAYYGLYGSSASPTGRGVYGKSTATAGTTSGISAESRSVSGRGIYAYASASTGPTVAIYGISRSSSGRGIAGVTTASTGSTIGVLARSYSTTGRGVYGYAISSTGRSVGVMGESVSTGGRGAFGYASSPTGSPTGIFGTVRSPDGWAGAFVSSAGNGVLISVPKGKVGLTVARGTKNAVVPTADGARLLYAEESTEVWFSDYGIAQLRAGKARILIDPTFAETVNLGEPYYVFLQPYGPAHLYVSTWDKDAFEVRARGRVQKVLFSYRIVAKRRGYEGARLERASWADGDPNLNHVQSPDSKAVGASATPAFNHEAGEAEEIADPATEAEPPSGPDLLADVDSVQLVPSSTQTGVEAVGGTHTHWGETWKGSGVGLTLTSTNSNAMLARSKATSGNVMGAFGSSASPEGSGICAMASASTGPAFGMYAIVRSTHGKAVYGFASATSGVTTGVLGMSASTRGRGIYAYANASTGTTYGAFGMSRSPDGRGVYGKTTSSTGITYGVYAISRSASGKAVYGYALSRTGVTYGVYGETRSPTGWAGRFISKYGNGVYISVPSNKVGLNVVGGTKNAVVHTSDGARLLYAEEATEVWFSDYGFAQAKNGQAVVEIDPIFAETVNLSEPYHVFLQPYGNAEIYVAERTKMHFIVRVREGDKNVLFAYRLVAKRRGHEHRRLERAPWADTDPNLGTENSSLPPEYPPEVDKSARDNADVLFMREEEENAPDNPVESDVHGTARAGTGVEGMVGIEAAAGSHTHWGNAWTGTSIGLRLTSTDGTALKGISQATYGPTCGIYAESASSVGRGVYAINTAASGYSTGAYGYTVSNAGSGVQGVASSTTGLNYGVYAIVRSSQGRGAYGYANATSGTTVGIYGESRSSNGRGVYAYAANPRGGAVGAMGVSRSNQGIGVYGLASATTGNTTGVYGTVRSPKGWAARFITKYGNGVYISVPTRKRGLNVISGTKNAVVWTSDGARLLYAEESTEVWFADYGFVRLRDGEAVVHIDPIFAQTVNLTDPYHVFLQPYGDAEVYVAARNPDSFVVRVRKGQGDVLVGYRIVAKRIGHEDRRLERAPWADDDPNLGQ